MNIQQIRREIDIIKLIKYVKEADFTGVININSEAVSLKDGMSYLIAVSREQP